MKNEMIKNMKSSIGTFVGNVGLKLRKSAPTTCIVFGVIGMSVTVVLACKETLEADKIIDEHNAKMEKVKQATEYAAEMDKPYDVKREKTIVYTKTAVNFAKLYAPSFGLGVLSIGLILTSHNILQKRYMGAVAAFNAVSDAFGAYRARVREECGEEMDRHFRYGTRKETIETTVTDEKGKEKKQKEEVEMVDDPLLPSDYAKYFDSSNDNWDENQAFSLMFLRAQQTMANDILQTRGHLFLNEVYDMLGFDHTPIGAVTGWVLGEGDNYVDFGLYDQTRDDVRRFINGKENVILLDFNVDGVIWDKI